MKKTPGSNCKDPQNRSKKKCVCGGHSKKKVKKKRAIKPTLLMENQ